MLKKITNKQIYFFIIIILCMIASLVFVYHNHAFYERPIAKVTEVDVTETTNVIDHHENEDTLFDQHIIAEIMNGTDKGQSVQLTNEYSYSGAYDHPYNIGEDRKSTRLNSSHVAISYAVFCLKKKKKTTRTILT